MISKLFITILSLAGTLYLLHMFYPAAFIPSLPVPLTVYMVSPGMIMMLVVLYVALKMSPGKH